MSDCCDGCGSNSLFPVGIKGDDGDQGIPGPAALTASGDPNTLGVNGTADGQVYTDASTGAQYTWDETNSVWVPLLDSSGNPVNTTGPSGTSAFVYIAYATNDAGAGFSLADPVGKDYLAVITTSTELDPPVASNFAGKWQLVRGESGAAGLPVGFVGMYVADTRLIGTGTPVSLGNLGDNIQGGGLGINNLAGWALCNGQTHSGYTTPDWEDKMIMGTVEPLFGQSSSINTTGGDNDITLSASNLPGHTHPGSFSGGSTSYSGSHNHTIDSGSGGILSGDGSGFQFTKEDDSNSHELSGVHHTAHSNTNSTGSHTHTVTGNVTVSAQTTSNNSFDNRPAFIRAAAIVRLPS